MMWVDLPEPLELVGGWKTTTECGHFLNGTPFTEHTVTLQWKDLDCGDCGDLSDAVAAFVAALDSSEESRVRSVI